jgi:hypothetical protein
LVCRLLFNILCVFWGWVSNLFMLWHLRSHLLLRFFIFLPHQSPVVEIL